MLGGSSSINGMYYVRGNIHDFSEWSELGWDYESVLPYFKKFEGNQHEEFVAYKNGKYHSADGPVKIDFAQDSPLVETFIETIRETGVTIIRDINADQKLGYVKLQLNSFNGTRSSTATSYLVPAKQRRNLRVLKHSFVDRILLNDKNEAYGVEFIYKGKHRLKALSKREVIVSAGTIQSPPLLMRSGIGPREHLNELNIPCKADLPVGENYIDHVAVPLFFSMNLSTASITTDEFDAIYQYVMHRSGPYALTNPLAAFIDTTNLNGFPDVQIMYRGFPHGSADSSFASLSKFYGFDIPKLLINNHYLDVSISVISLIKPKSRGVIKLNECDGCQEVTIQSNYLKDLQDRKTILRAIKHQTELMKTTPFQKINTTLLRLQLPECNELDYESDAYWECYMKSISISGSHQLGTSKMGTDSKSVVDPRLKVHKIKKLRQIDGGV